MSFFAILFFIFILMRLPREPTAGCCAVFPVKIFNEKNRWFSYRRISLLYLRLKESYTLFSLQGLLERDLHDITSSNWMSVANWFANKKAESFVPNFFIMQLTKNLQIPLIIITNNFCTWCDYSFGFFFSHTLGWLVVWMWPWSTSVRYRLSDSQLHINMIVLKIWVSSS